MAQFPRQRHDILDEHDRFSRPVFGSIVLHGAVFLGVAVMRVDAPFQRYAAEFFGRVLLATFPAAVVLAARGAAWVWNHGANGRIASALLILWAIVPGTQHWMVWFRAV